MSRNKTLNIQAIARQDKGLMSCIIPSQDHVFVSQDVVSGEPTITCHLTKDAMYYNFIFGMVGKTPYWDRGTLMVDDIYLGYASSVSFWQKAIKDKFDPNEWVTDAESVKGKLKGIRKASKISVLGHGYGMGPKKLELQMYDNGISLTMAECKEAYKTFWSLFSDIKDYSEYLKEKIEHDGYLINLFGYRITPTPHKAYNYMIQSSLSGLMHVYTNMMAEKSPYAKYITCIHDEIVWEIPRTRIEEFKADQKDVVTRLNAILGWSVDVRFGFAVGNNMYEAK